MKDLTQKEMLIKLVTEFIAMKEDITEIKGYTSRINGGLRMAQEDVVAINTRCGSCQENIKDIRTRMNVFTTVATIGGGILGWLGSFIK
jgi:hypothetical protein